MDRPFLQTPEWLAFQKSLGRKVWRLDDGFIKANIIRHDVRLGPNWLYIPYGPELNLELAKEGLRNEITHFAAFLRGLAKQQGSMFVKIEPTHDMVIELLYRNGVRLKKSPHAVQPMHTVVMDLTLTEDQLLDGLHHKHRYNINLAERKGVTVDESDDVEAFTKMLEGTSAKGDFRAHPKLYYKKLMNFFASGPTRTRLFFAYHGGAPIAGVLMLEQGKTVYYLHGASDNEQRALMAPHLLHWTLMKRYKAQGFKWYDFWGVDARRWPGVTRFKFGFGGKLVEYPGSFDLVRKPFLRWAYNHLPR
jgi:lipid II:glycine glycyltransferase (peptidoglycan interpeptide bridge formation enzyme)